MNIYSSLDNIAFEKPTAVTIGNFDGVHLGHKELINRTIAIGEEKDILPVMFTFSNHPLEFLYKKQIDYLTSFEQKVKIIEQMGINDLVSVPFDYAIKDMSTEVFAKEILLSKLNATDIIMGFDSKLGNGRQGSVDYLYEVGKKLGFDVHIVEPVMIENMRVSSSFIRELIKTGEVKRAEFFLGRKYMLEGKVVHGKKLGRKLGFPTANLEVNQDILLPKRGVYFCKIEVDGKTYDAAVSIGYNPTIQSNKPFQEIFVEAHILEFEDDIYGKSVKLYFMDRLRDELKFNSLDDLIRQLNRDVLRIKNYIFT
ncbi:bifunctional riboflavin kinase/FAD synthetase [Acetoanaerobium noterae]|uniref:bifunctional riboflavin kinase/FAD synthetase n=1 Tax=Acetoanaerobium noterae TaxID=745369 RepID=UPI003242B189